MSPFFSNQATTLIIERRRLTRLFINVHLVLVDYKVFHSVWDYNLPSVQYFVPKSLVLSNSFVLHLLSEELLLLL
jgi:hypothetical protein